MRNSQLERNREKYKRIGTIPKRSVLMDKIYVNGMDFYGYHGVYEEENKLGQRFSADVILEMDTKEAGRTDNLNLTVNYAEVYEKV
jgi:dihydroneopterin aldolase